MASSPTHSDASAAAANGDTPTSSAAPTPTPTSSANTTPAESVDLEAPSQTARATEPQDAHKLAGVKRKLKSKVWEEFERVFFNGKWKAECQWCHNKLGGETKDGTSHLHAHLATCPARQTTTAWKQAKLKLTKAEDGKVNVENYIFDQELCRKELALMICCHEYPLAIVDHAGFRKFCAMLQPMFKVVCRNTIRKDILEMHEGQRDKLIKYFANFKNRVAVTSDMWTAGHQKKYELMQQMSEEMKKKFQKYWTDIHGLMAIATVLDPRYKLHMVHALYGPLYGPEAATEEVARVKRLLRDLLVEYQDASSAGTSNAASASQPTTPASQDEVFDIFERYMSSQPTTSSLLVHTELDMYLEEPTLPRTPDFDIINWWKFGGIKYPTLQLIAHDIFPIPVTTVASESAFSTSGRILSPHRSRLAPKMVKAIMCMQAWSNADILGENNSSLFSEFQTSLDDEDEPMDEELSTCNNY